MPQNSELVMKILVVPDCKHASGSLGCILGQNSIQQIKYLTLNDWSRGEQ